MRKSLLPEQGLKSEGIISVDGLVSYLYLKKQYLLASPVLARWKKYQKCMIQIRISCICIVFDL